MTARLSVVLVSSVVLGALAVSANAQQPAAEIYRPGPGIRNPTLIKEVKPQYTPAAMRARIVGTVSLEVVVKKDGTVGDVRVTKSLDAVHGLDEEAIRAARQWVFGPARRNGEPVDIYVTLELAFRLRQGPFGVGAHRSGEAGLVMPVVARGLKPEYTPEGMRRKIQGVVVVEVVVGTDGTVTDARVIESLDREAGLDESALQAARRWTFEPGTLGGRAVPVLTAITLTFRLQ